MNLYYFIDKHTGEIIFKEFEGAKLKFKEIEEKVSDNEFKFDNEYTMNRNGTRSNCLDNKVKIKKNLHSYKITIVYQSELKLSLKVFRLIIPDLEDILQASNKSSGNITVIVPVNVEETGSTEEVKSLGVIIL